MGGFRKFVTAFFLIYNLMGLKTRRLFYRILSDKWILKFDDLF